MRRPRQGRNRAPSHGRAKLAFLLLFLALFVTYVTVAFQVLVRNAPLSPASSADQSGRGGRGAPLTAGATLPLTAAATTPVGPDPFPSSVATAAATAAAPAGAAEYETIPHPATEADGDGAGTRAVPMQVPRFWDPPRFREAGGVRSHLGRGGRRPPTAEEAAAVGSLVASPGAEAPLETIYVAISSYRDWQCSGTVEDVFRRAAHPERIRVGVVDQYDAGVDGRCAAPQVPCDADPDQVLCRYRDQIDAYGMDASLGVGPVFARHIGHRMYRGEYFAMQCDAHVKFVRGWDVLLIQQWRAAGNEMAVLSNYLSDVQGAIDEVTGDSLIKSRPIMCRTDYEGQGDQRHLRHGQQPEGVPGIHGEPTLQPYWAAGFSFSRGHFVVQVPYDQHLPLIFQGEEISIGIRGFTYGYDYYAPEHSVCFHMYAFGENKAKRKKVPSFWEHQNLYKGVGKKSMKRLLGIIDMANPGVDRDQWLAIEEEKYGTGRVRSVQKFLDTFGVHHETHTVEGHLCRFAGKSMMEEFQPYLREDKMGIDYDKITYQFKDPNPTEKAPPLLGKRGKQ